MILLTKTDAANKGTLALEERASGGPLFWYFIFNLKPKNKNKTQISSF